MSTSFANEQPEGFKNHVVNVAIVGASGRVGGHIAAALIEDKKHQVTAITRPESTGKMPSGLHDTKKVDYNDHASLVKALQGHDVLIITMSVMAPKENTANLINAAVEAGVRWIMPNEWGVDSPHTTAGKDTLLGDRMLATREHIVKAGAGKTQWIGLCCGFWYEFSLAGTEARFGFDFDQKTLTLYDDGNTKINTSTWPQVGRAVSKLLSLKILPDNKDDTSPCLSQYNNKSAYISSFFISQRDMFDSVLRVTGDKEEDWKVTYEDVVERFQRGQKLFFEEKKMVGFGILLYARMFYNDGSSNFNDKLANKLLGLPTEDLDEATKVGIKMWHAGERNMG